MSERSFFVIKNGKYASIVSDWNVAEIMFALLDVQFDNSDSLECVEDVVKFDQQVVFDLMSEGMATAGNTTIVP